jgi:hypothetical protein
MNNSNQTNIPIHLDDKLFELTWNEILYDGGLATWVPRVSFRWLSIGICLIGVLGKIDLFLIVIVFFMSILLGNLLAICTLLRPRMRTLSTCTYLTALCISNIATLLSVIVFESDVLVDPDRLNCLVISTSKAFASTTFALSTW